MRAMRDNSRLVTVLGFVLGCLAGLMFLWVKAGGTVPVVTQPNDYQVSFLAGDVKNLKNLGDVKIAGVEVGQVESRSLDGDGVRVVLSLDDDVAPLHEGATVRIGVKSPVGSSYVEVVDGDGTAIEDGTQLPAEDVVPAVDVDELYDTLDAPTRRSLSRAVQSLGDATEGTGQSLDRTMTGLGDIADDGGTALDALAAQSADLRELSIEARRLLEALDTGRGQIASLVSDAQRLTTATADKQDAVEETVRALPELLRNVRAGAVSLRELSGPLAPVAQDLRRAAPDLDRALVNLPAVTRDLDGLLPSLDGTLDRAPATLDEVPAFDASVRQLIPDTETLLQDANPMLAYLAPYGHDLGALFASFGASFDTLAEDGIRPIRLTATAEGLGTVRGNPVPFGQTSLLWNNPYPDPGDVGDPEPFTGSYPQVHRDSK